MLQVLQSGRAVSVYGSGKGFILKIHDSLGFKFRCSHFNGAGTVQHDILCLDATESKAPERTTKTVKFNAHTLVLHSN